MTYAFITEGMDFEKREEFDTILNHDPEKVKARREREFVGRLLGMPRVQK